MRQGIFTLTLAALTAAVSLCAASPASAKAKPESKDVAMVELFLKTPTSNLPADSIEDFLKIDPATLPKKLREPYRIKKAQLESLKKVYEMGNQGSKILPTKDCASIAKGDSSLIAQLQASKFQEITEEEEVWLNKNTRCRQDEMMCKFTLQVVDEKITKNKSRRRYFLYCDEPTCDPLMVLVGFKRQGAVPDNSGSFGESNFPTCH